MIGDREPPLDALDDEPARSVRVDVSEPCVVRVDHDDRRLIAREQAPRLRDQDVVVPEAHPLQRGVDLRGRVLRPGS